MVIGYHVVLGAYGFWLPNDPRGSWSKYVWARHLKQFGPATKVAARQSLAAKQHDRVKRIDAKSALRYPTVQFTGLQARRIVDGFAELTAKLRLSVHACSIMPDHAYLVLGRRQRDTEEVVGLLKRAGTRMLNKTGINPMKEFPRGNGRLPSFWSENWWIVYIDTEAQMRKAMEYVESNPIKA